MKDIEIKEIVISDEDYFYVKIKADVEHVLTIYSYSDFTAMLNGICTTDSLLDYIENTDDFNFDGDKIHASVFSAIENFIDTRRHILRKEQLREYVTDRYSLADNLSIMYFYEIMAIRRAKKRRKQVEQLDKEIAVYHED